MTVVPMMWVGYAGMPRRILDYPSTLGGWHSIISAGHMLSVAGLLAFFFMIADSKRQSKVWVPTTVLGVGRFNTRVLFYRYEFNRHQFMAERVSSISHADSIKPFETRWNYYKNNEYLDLTPITYSFHI
jgi:heme/copper-type cytochrome/quinol oxidase subunit 1